MELSLRFPGALPFGRHPNQWTKEQRMVVIGYLNHKKDSEDSPDGNVVCHRYNRRK